MLGDAVFGLEICHDQPLDRFWLRYWVEGLAPSQVLNSFGLQFQGIEDLRAYLRNGYTSWDGSAYVDVEALANFGSHETRPEWVVRDRRSSGPLIQWRLVGEERWHKPSEEYYTLDATYPEAFEYLRQVFHTWRHEWGCEYFRTGFMQFGSEHGPE
jgi:hypothetical protein